MAKITKKTTNRYLCIYEKRTAYASIFRELRFWGMYQAGREAKNTHSKH